MSESGYPPTAASPREALAPSRQSPSLGHHPASESWLDERATIHGLFEACAAKTPHAIALVAESAEVSYRALDARANQLARHLVARGVEPGSVVALLAERSVDTIVAVLAILKAGAAYAPLDPGDPRERLAVLLEDLRPSAVVVERALEAALPELDAPLVVVDAEREAIARESAERLAVEAGRERLAYVMYTSGSTGMPKGVCVPHRAVVRLVCGADYVALDARETLLHFAPLSFDASTFEIWGALLNGARLVLAPPAALSLAELGALVERRAVSTLWLTAGLFHQMVDRHVASLGSVRQLLAGGDVLSPEHVRRALAALPRCTIVNGYGPTENTTFTCCHRMAPGTEIGATVPIGRPIAGTHVYLLDEAMHPVAAGETGELYAAGDGLAVGYLNRPDLTAQRFVDDPFAAEPGARMYRTGDLARVGDDGAIEFLGRADGQVKLRGFRVEPGEVEAALLRHASVAEAAVVGRGRENDRRLVAYVVARGARLATSELRAYLGTLLPDYMIPSAFVALDALPLTANGKIDRAALPDPDRRRPELAVAYAEPRTATELLVAAALRDVISVDRIGLDDNFFELGASSLTLTLAHDALRSRVATPFALVAMFEHPTVRALASHLSTERVDAGLSGARARALRQRAALGRRVRTGAEASHE